MSTPELTVRVVLTESIFVPEGQGMEHDPAIFIPKGTEGTVGRVERTDDVYVFWDAAIVADRAVKWWEWAVSPRCLEFRGITTEQP